MEDKRHRGISYVLELCFFFLCLALYLSEHVTLHVIGLYLHLARS